MLQYLELPCGSPPVDPERLVFTKFVLSCVEEKGKLKKTYEKYQKKLAKERKLSEVRSEERR